MAFEDFIKEKEVTVNKNIKYADDAEEPEDYSVVAASAKPLAEDDDEDEGEDDEKEGNELEDKGDKKVDSEDDKEKADHYKGAVKSDDSEIDALKKDAEYDEEEEKKDESRIMSFSNFVTESYDEDEVEEEEDGVSIFFSRLTLRAAAVEFILRNLFVSHCVGERISFPSLQDQDDSTMLSNKARKSSSSSFEISTLI